MIRLRVLNPEGLYLAGRNLAVGDVIELPVSMEELAQAWVRAELVEYVDQPSVGPSKRKTDGPKEHKRK